jgi:hypothetical protein
MDTSWNTLQKGMHQTLPSWRCTLGEAWDATMHLSQMLSSRLLHLLVAVVILPPKVRVEYEQPVK